MKNRFATIMVTFTICLLIFPSISNAGPKVHGVLRVVKGDVKIKTARGKITKARVGQKVFPKDTIITAKDSRAKIIMTDKNEINVSPASEVIFANYEYEPKKNKKNVLLNVIYGKVRSKVNQKYDGKQSKFQVKTPSAVAGVRGTDFFTAYNLKTKATSVVTFEGTVQYGLPSIGGGILNAVSVKAGQMASNKAGQAPAPPRAVPKNQLANMDMDSDADKAAKQPKRRRPAKEDKKDKRDKKDKPKEDQANEPPPQDNAAAPGDSAANNGETNADGPAPLEGGAMPPAPGEDGQRTAGPDGKPLDPAMGDMPPMPNGDGMMPPPGDRDPASFPGGGGPDSMLMPEDMAGMAPDTYILPDTNTDPTYMLPPPTAPPMYECSTCDRIIENGNTRLLINVINN